jgi:hypothetical protein
VYVSALKRGGGASVWHGVGWRGASRQVSLGWWGGTAEAEQLSG